MSQENATPGKKLSELRVIDLKQELDKRGLEKTGVKASLLDRLKKALESEGQDPEQFVFDLIGSRKSKPDDSLQEDPEEVASNKKDEEELGDIDLDGVDCEIMEDDGIDIGDFDNEILDETPKDLENTLKKKTTLTETIKPEAVTEQITASESSRDEQKPAISTEDEKTGIKAAPVETKPTVPEIIVDVSSVSTKASSNVEPSLVDCKQENKENLLGDLASAPPTPTSMLPIAPFTSEDTIKMDTSSDRKEDDISLIVHVDESQNEFDMPETHAKSRTDENTNLSSSSMDILQVNIEEKAAADAEKDFLMKHNSGNTVITGENQPVNVKEETEEDKKVTEGKMELETTSTQESQEQTGTTTSSKDEASATKETSVETKDTKAGSKKIDVKSKGSVNSRNLWISGLSTSTRATDLKALFSKYGKVAGAKVVTNARSPGSRCYGFVSMNTAEEASKCIQYLHRTELHGRMISVERAKTDPSQAKAITAPKKTVGKPAEVKEDANQKETEKQSGEKDKKEIDKEGDKKELEKKDEKKSTDVRRHSSGDRRHSHGSSRTYRKRSRSPVRTHGHSRHRSSKDKDKKEDPKKKEIAEDKSKGTETTKKEEGKTDEKKEEGAEKKEGDKKAEDKKDSEKKTESKPKEKEMLSLEKIKEERERERLRQRERRLREEERRRREMADRDRARQRDIMARQREEAVRLQRERERLKLERERLEREKLEAEREKLRLERERRERERQELAEQRRLEALRYEERQRAMKRPYDHRGGDDYWGEPKRATYDQRDGRYSDYDGRQPSSYNDGSHQQDRRIERYDRNTGRTVERDHQRSFDRREEHRGSQSRANDRRDMRRDPASARDRDDRGRPDDRYSKYESERREPPVRDHDRREQRRASPHRAPPRESPSNRRNDPGSSSYRGGGSIANDRPGRDRGHDTRGPNDRSYSAHSGGHGNQRGADNSDWQQNSSGATGGPRDNKESRSYTRGSGSHGGAGPGPAGILVNHHHKPVSDAPGSTNPGNWAAPERRPTHVVVQPPADPRGWTNVTSVAPRTVVNTPMLQVQPAPTTNAFLASAANIMMGVGLARGTDTRYDAYKGLPATLRRY